MHSNNGSVHSGQKVRVLTGFALVGMLLSTPAAAIDFELGPISGSMDNLLSFGTMVRMQGRDPDLIGKSNLQPGLCTQFRDDDQQPDRVTSPSGLRWEGPEGTTLSNTSDNNGGAPAAGAIGNTCNVSGNADINQLYVAEPGTFNINGDDGNLNFDKHDIVSANFKLTSDFSFSIGGIPLIDDLNFFIRTYYFYDEVVTGLNQFHPDATSFGGPNGGAADAVVRARPTRTPLPRYVESLHGTDFDVLDANVSFFLPFFFERELAIKIGSQAVNWGESSFLLLNSLNSINPPAPGRLRLPGFDLKELSEPSGMVTVNTEITDTVSLEMFYQYEWKPLEADAPGSFFSTSDVVGGDNSQRRAAMLSFGKAPEDPNAVYVTRDNQDDPIGLISNASRTIFLEPGLEKRPDDGGQYGFAVRYFAEEFNNGTEFGFYYANYHARVPSISALAAQGGCIGEATNTVPGAIADCGDGPVGSPAVGRLTVAGVPVLNEEVLPVDTARLFIEYPEDIRMFGVSFNTTVGDWALSGEYVYRPNLPVQIHTTDLLFAALQPAFPANSLAIPGVGNLPTRRIAVPDFVETRFRGRRVIDTDGDGFADGGYEIRGFEPQKVGQLGLTLLKTIGGDNPFNASQIIVLMESGFTHVIDMPDLSELQFQGARTNSHISEGADGTGRGLSTDSDETGSAADNNVCAPLVDATGANNDTPGNPCLQNPTTQARENFGSDFSWGFRYINLFKYDNALLGANLELLLGVLYDVDGVSPGLGMNHVEGNLTTLTGLRFDYLGTWNGELRYTNLSGDKNARRDRDNLMFTVRYAF